MRTLKATADAADGTRLLRRCAWILTSTDPEGYEIIDTVSLTPLAGYEPVILLYPRIAIGRQGEARYVHLPSYPGRLCHRALTGDLV